MRLALVHDWIVSMGGAERTLKEMTHLWPDAPVYTLFADQRTIREHFPNTDIRTSRLQRIPGITRIYPALAPLMPSAIESFDLSGFDTVLSSSVMFAKGIIVRPDTRHICYCYSPSRMLWDRSAAYEHRGILSHAVRHTLRSWDQAASHRPDQIVAISQTVAGRINKYYRRDAVVVPPPVRMGLNTPGHQLMAHGYWLVVARLVPHKNLDIVLEAFAKLRYHLVIVGDGPLRRHLVKKAGSNVTFAGTVSDGQLDTWYDHCQAVIVPNEEDFGLTAVEAMAHGKPVLALRRGGATETVVQGVSGEFFDDPIPEALVDGIRRIHDAAHSYHAEDIRQHAAAWSTAHWSQRIQTLVQSA